MYDGLTPLFNRVTAADVNRLFKPETLGTATPGPDDHRDAEAGRVDHLRRLPRRPHPRRHPRRRHLGRGLGHRRAARAAAPAGPLRLARRGDRRARAQRARARLQPEELHPQRPDRGRGRQADGARCWPTAPRGAPCCTTSTSTWPASTRTSPPTAATRTRSPAPTSTRSTRSRTSSSARAGATRRCARSSCRRSATSSERSRARRCGTTCGRPTIPRRRSASPATSASRPPPVSHQRQRRSSTPAASTPRPRRRRPPPAPRATHASNALLVSGARSATHHPIMVAGPQIGYFYPGLTLEVDEQGPGISQRGVTSAPFPGYIFIGRSQDSGWSLTSAGLDQIDTYVETLCGHSTHQLPVPRPLPGDAVLRRRQARRTTRRSASTAPSTARCSATPACTAAWWRCRRKRASYGARRARPALLPRPRARRGPQRPPVLPRRRPDPADVQLALRGRPGHRRVHQRPDPDPARGTSTRRCRSTAAVARSGTAGYSAQNHPQGINPANGRDRQLEQPHRGRLRGAGRQLVARRRAARLAAAAQPRHRRRRHPAGDGRRR